MRYKYKNWINKHVSEHYGKCTEATILMAKAFPELQRIRGHYVCPFVDKKREHWWLVTKKGDIVDPTAKQFLSGGNGEYIPWIEGSPEPTGKCQNCGEYAYNNNYFCYTCVFQR